MNIYKLINCFKLKFLNFLIDNEAVVSLVTDILIIIKLRKEPITFKFF